MQLPTQQFSLVENQRSIERQVNFQGLDAKKIELLKTQIMPPRSSDNELALFLHIIRRTKLDPFSRQIYAIRRTGDKMNFEVSIDGARLIAERTGLYKGQKGPFWCDDDGIWSDVWTKLKMPFAAKLGVLREGFNEPLWATAIYKEYRPAGKQAFMWDKFPTLMIAKVAEMLALRRAFPCELSGLYSQEEMQQSISVSSAPNVATEEHLVAEQIISLIKKLTKNFEDEDKLEWLLDAYSVPSSKELRNGSLSKDKMINILKNLQQREYVENAEQIALENKEN